MFQSNSRNVTGSFLGKESGSESTTTRLSSGLHTPKIRPLQTGRGRFARTTAELNRHKKVEAIRERETYRGFSGRPLNLAQRPKTSPCASHNMKQSYEGDVTPSAEDIKTLTRQNARQFTAVNNHGMVHREYLTYPPENKLLGASNGLPAELTAALALTATVDGLCQNESQALKTLRSSKSAWPTGQYTGFYIRGYKKPPTAQILAELPQSNLVGSQQRRPKTAATFGSNRELLVPQPFIYSGSSNVARRVGVKLTPSSQQPSTQPIAFADEVVDLYSTDRPANSGQTLAQEEQWEGNRSTSQLLGTFEHAMPIMKKTLATKDSRSNQLAADDDSIPKINIALETDDGDVRLPEIDEVEENFGEETERTDGTGSPARRLSITDRLQKIRLGEDYANSVKVEAQRRRKALENLLEEHEHLVRQIVSADTKLEAKSK